MTPPETCWRAGWDGHAAKLDTAARAEAACCAAWDSGWAAAAGGTLRDANPYVKKAHGLGGLPDDAHAPSMCWAAGWSYYMAGGGQNDRDGWNCADWLAGWNAAAGGNRKEANPHAAVTVGP